MPHHVPLCAILCLTGPLSLYSLITVTQVKAVAEQNKANVIDASTTAALFEAETRNLTALSLRGNETILQETKVYQEVADREKVPTIHIAHTRSPCLSATLSFCHPACFSVRRSVSQPLCDTASSLLNLKPCVVLILILNLALHLSSLLYLGPMFPLRLLFFMFRVLIFCSGRGRRRSCCSRATEQHSGRVV